MKLRIVMTSTARFDTLPGGEVCRVWDGRTEKGVEVCVRVKDVWLRNATDTERVRVGPNRRIAMESTDTLGTLFTGEPYRWWHGVLDDAREVWLRVPKIGYHPHEKAEDEMVTDLMPLNQARRDVSGIVCPE